MQKNMQRNAAVYRT